MVSIYFLAGQLPVEFLPCIAITVITRTLVSFEELSEGRVIVATPSVRVLAVAAVLLRWGASTFSPSDAGAAKHTGLPR
jgi:phosphate starvation-inducible membrane PsiE